MIGNLAKLFATATGVLVIMVKSENDKASSKMFDVV